MPRHDYDENTAECLVFTYKDGLLSAIAHDLKIRVSRFQVTVETDAGQEKKSVQARFDAASLRVVCAMEAKSERPGLLSESDRRKIEHNIAAEVLDAQRYKEVLFSSSSVSEEGEGYRIAGQLTLHGRSQEIRFTTHLEDGRQVAEVTLHQPAFGIKPYSAMLGTLKIKPDLTVRIAVPGE